MTKAKKSAPTRPAMPPARGRSGEATEHSAPTTTEGLGFTGRQEGGWLEPIERGYGAHHETVRGWFAQPTCDQALSLTKEQLGIDLRCDLCGDLSLEYQDIVQFTIETANPGHFAAGTNIKQSGNRTNAAA